MSKVIHSIKVSNIDRADKRFLHFRSFLDTKTLAQSIQDTGLINPVLLRPVNDRYIIVSGYNRVLAFKHNNESVIPAFLTGSKETEFDCLVKAITAVAFKRELSNIELIRCLVHLNKYQNARQIADSGPRLFNMSLNSRYVNQLIDIGDMANLALTLIETGRLTIKTAKKLIKFPFEAQHGLIQLFSKIKASASVQSEMVLHLFEISRRDGCPMESILVDYGINDLLQDSLLEDIEKTRKIRDILYQARFPNLSLEKKRIKEKIGALKQGPDLKIETSDNFEDRNVHFAFRIKTDQQFKKQIENLKRIADQSEFKDVLNP